MSDSNVSSANSFKIWIPNSKSVVLKSRPCYLGMHTCIAFSGLVWKESTHNLHSFTWSPLKQGQQTQLSKLPVYTVGHPAVVLENSETGSLGTCQLHRYHIFY